VLVLKYKDKDHFLRINILTYITLKGYICTTIIKSPLTDYYNGIASVAQCDEEKRLYQDIPYFQNII